MKKILKLIEKTENLDFKIMPQPKYTIGERIKFKDKYDDYVEGHVVIKRIPGFLLSAYE